MTHTRYYYAITQDRKCYLKFYKDFGCYVRCLPDGGAFPEWFYFGERCLYLTPGRDHNSGGGFRGNRSDDWPCIDFGRDLQEALDWLHGAEEPDRTLELWTKNPDYNIYA